MTDTPKKPAAKKAAPKPEAAETVAEAPARKPKVDDAPAIRKSLQQGDRGAAVAWAQERLTALGFEVGRHDGYYSSVMMKAVRQFESSKGLKITGVLTADRYELLK